MKALLLLALLAAPALAQDAPVPPVSRWATLPRLQYRPDYKPRLAWVERAHALDGSEGCTLAADAGGIVRLKVPFVVLLSAKGQVLQAKADMPACPAMAALIEQFARQQGPKTILPPDGAPPLWRASHFLAGWPKQTAPEPAPR